MYVAETLSEKQFTHYWERYLLMLKEIVPKRERQYEAAPTDDNLFKLKKSLNLMNTLKVIAATAIEEEPDVIPRLPIR
jgi:hypothetical protein